jgi:pyruvate/2-oxoglutarate dehydrogenase complex dihydrolipoamide dehydrogenase (E3) component
MAFDYDIIALGGGTAGLVTAAGAAGLGARAALVERHRMGGECLWNGCVPSKALLACARAAADARSAHRYGVHASDVRVDFAEVMQHVRTARSTIEPHDSPERFRGLGVDVMLGEARFVGERSLRIDNRTVSARHIVIATGSRPLVPDIAGLETVPFLTNETIFDIDELPASLIVLGGGAIGVELAQAFALLGSSVTVLEAAPRILAHEDTELTDILAQEMIAAGITLKLGARVESVERNGAGVRVRAEGVAFDGAVLLVATGRAAVLDTLDLSAGGVDVIKEQLVLDDRLRTSARNVWAAGDVTGGPRFTHVADYQARTVLRNALFPLSASVDYDVVPRVTYCMPELASVGLTHAAAVERHGKTVQVFTRPFASLDRAIADGRTTGLCKIVADAKGRILGGHVLGNHASTIIAEITVAMREGVPLSRLASVLHAYPSYAEVVKQSADAFMRTRLTGLARSVAGWLVRHV